MADEPHELTCNACLDAPATLLAVLSRTNADRTPAPGHVLRLLCGECADRTRVICGAAGRAVTFRAVGPVAEVPGATTDPLSAELDAIGDRIEHGSRLKVAEEDTPRLLTALRLLLKAHARYTTTELYAELLTALRGEPS